MRNVLVVLAIASMATVAIADDLTTNGSTAARYMVNLGRDFGDSVSLVDAPSGLYDYAKYRGNGAPWSRLNDGSLNETCVTFLHDDPDMGPDFFGYQFKHAATVSELNLTDFSFGDGGRFNATPTVEVLTAPLKQGGTWVAVPGVTWNTPYDSTLVGGASNSYTITADTPITGAWGVRLAGDANPGASPDPNGFLAVKELQVSGAPEFGRPVDLSTNLALGAQGIASNFQFGNPAAITDGDLTTLETTFGGTDPEDYMGVTWDAPKNGVTAVGMTLKWFGDGGWFDEQGGNPLNVEYTTDGGSTWTAVTGLDKGRYPADYLDLEAFIWDYEGAFLFTFDPVSGIDGVRVVGDGGGPADGNGFIASYEFEVFAVPEPAAMLLLVIGSALIRRR